MYLYTTYIYILQRWIRDLNTEQARDVWIGVSFSAKSVEDVVLYIIPVWARQNSGDYIYYLNLLFLDAFTYVYVKKSTLVFEMFTHLNQIW